MQISLQALFVRNGLEKQTQRYTTKNSNEQSENNRRKKIVAHLEKISLKTQTIQALFLTLLRFCNTSKKRAFQSTFCIGIIKIASRKKFKQIFK